MESIHPRTVTNLEVGWHEFEDEVDVSLVWVNVNEVHHVGVMQLAQKLDFTQCRNIHSLLTVTQVYLLNGTGFSSLR